MFDPTGRPVIQRVGGSGSGSPPRLRRRVQPVRMSNHPCSNFLTTFHINHNIRQDMQHELVLVCCMGKAYFFMIHGSKLQDKVPKF